MKVWACLALLFWAPFGLLAEVLTHPEAKITIDVPDHWKQELDDEVLTIEHPSGDMSIVFMVLDPELVSKKK